MSTTRYRLFGRFTVFSVEADEEAKQVTGAPDALSTHTEYGGHVEPPEEYAMPQRLGFS